MRSLRQKVLNKAEKNAAQRDFIVSTHFRSDRRDWDPWRIWSCGTLAHGYGMSMSMCKQIEDYSGQWRFERKEEEILWCTCRLVFLSSASLHFVVVVLSECHCVIRLCFDARCAGELLRWWESGSWQREWAASVSEQQAWVSKREWAVLLSHVETS
jgi:hypothetical protein